MTSVNDCASALIETIPQVMQEIRRHVRSSRGTDLSVLQLRALAFLDGAPGAPLSAVAEHVGLTLPSASSQVSNLVERGLIHRATSPTDRRYVTLMLTEEGHLLLDWVRQKAQESLAAELTHLSAEQRQQLLEAAALLRSVFSVKST
ncbi:MAG: MarR family winged helix-turn-helix transcriptional regulator [Caldilineaceae bacterium]